MAWFAFPADAIMVWPGFLEGDDCSGGNRKRWRQEPLLTVQM